MNTNYVESLVSIVELSRSNNSPAQLDNVSNVLKEFVYSDKFANYTRIDLEIALKIFGYKLTQKSTAKDVENLIIDFLKIPIDNTGKGYKNYLKGSSFTVFVNRATKFLVIPLASDLQRYEHLEQCEFSNEAQFEIDFNGYNVYVLDSEHNIVLISNF